MFKSIAKHPFRSLFIVLGVIALVCLTLSWVLTQALLEEPVCDDWQPGMTKEEKIRMAIEVANQAKLARFKFENKETGEIYFRSGRQIPYDSLKFIEETPNCCNLYERFSARTDKPNEVLPKGDEGVVVLRYQGKYRDQSGEINFAPVEWYADLNLCKKWRISWFRH